MQIFLATVPWSSNINLKFFNFCVTWVSFGRLIWNLIQVASADNQLQSWWAIHSFCQWGSFYWYCMLHLWLLLYHFIASHINYWPYICWTCTKFHQQECAIFCYRLMFRLDGLYIKYLVEQPWIVLSGIPNTISWHLLEMIKISTCKMKVIINFHDSF